MSRIDRLIGASERLRTHALRFRKAAERLNVSILAWRQVLQYHQSELSSDFQIGAGMCYRQEQDALIELGETTVDINNDILSFIDESVKMMDFLEKEIKKLPDDFKDEDNEE